MSLKNETKVITNRTFVGYSPPEIARGNNGNVGRARSLGCFSITRAQHTKWVVRVTSIRMCMMMVHWRSICHVHAWWRWSLLLLLLLLLLHLRRDARLWLRDANVTWTRHLVCLRARVLAAGGVLVHPPHTPATQFRVGIAVPPAIDRSLYETTFPAQARIQLGQRPSHRVTFRLIDDPIASVILFRPTGPWIHTILVLEGGIQILHIHRFDIAADCILHLDSVS